MVQLSAAVLLPVTVKITPCALAQVAETRHVTHRRVQPNVEKLARRIWNLKTEVRCIAADVPLLQPSVEPLGQLVGDLRLQGATARPLLQPVGKLRQLEEVVLRVTLHRRSA